MRRLSIFAACAALFLGACGESSLPDPSGKGSVRAINAIPASPGITFLIEERSLGVIEYQGGNTATAFDNFTYNFNFEVLYLGDTEPTRIATQQLQVTADTDHIFVLGGTLDNPTVTVWESPEREWSGSETDFELRFGHLAGTYGDIDIYAVPESEVASANNLADTLSFGEVGTASLVAEGTYTFVATTAGDIDDVVYQSGAIAFVAQTSLLVAFFDGDENDLSPVAARGIYQASGTIGFADDRIDPTMRYIHASADLGPVDIYDDEALANRVIAGQVFGDISADIPREAGSWTATYTVPNDNGVVLFDQDINTVNGTRTTLYALGQGGEYGGVVLRRNQRSVSTYAQFNFFQASSNHAAVDIYIGDPGTLVDDASPRVTNIPLGLSTGNNPIAAGDYEIYVTPNGEKTVLAGPFAVSAALGDVVEFLILDDPLDPAIVEIRTIP